MGLNLASSKVRCKWCQSHANRQGLIHLVHLQKNQKKENIDSHKGAPKKHTKI